MVGVDRMILPKEKQNMVIAVAVPEELIKRLDAVAEQDCSNRSAAMRKILTRGLEKNGRS